MTPGTIWLTGASRGIGRALALRLARDGGRLVLAGRDREALDRVVGEVRARGAEVRALAFDLRNEAAILDFVATAREIFGSPDILVNNAGFNPRKAPVGDIETPEFDDIVAVNLRAPFILLREAFRDMKTRGRGHIVNVLSTVCHYANENMGAYTAAKAGLQALTAVFRKEARPFGVRVSSIYPGGTDTEFRKKRREDYMRPESVAEVIATILALPEDAVVHELTFRPMVEVNF